MKWNRKYVVSGAVVAGLALGATAIAPRGQQALASGQADMMSMLSARSPGARPEGALATKGPRMAMAAPAAFRPAGARPRQSAVLPLSVPAAPAVVAGGAPLPAVIAAPAPAVVAPLAAGGSPLLGAAAVPVAAGGGGLGAGAALLAIPAAAAVLAPGGGGGGSTVTAPDTVPAIPEPGTWLMMIVGFGILGSWLRRKRRDSRPSGALRNPGLATG